MSRVIKSRDIKFKPDAVRLPVIVPIAYDDPGARATVQRGLEQTARAAVDRLVKEAEERARAVLDRAQSEADALREKAKAEGFEAGRREGLLRAKKDAEEAARGMREEAARTLEEARAEALRTVRQAEPTIVKIALSVARKVIKREVTADPEIVLANVREALRSVGREESVTIKCSPAEVAVVHDARDGLRREFPGLGEIVVEEDGSVEPGGCVVATERGTVDARLDSQIGAVAEKISEVFVERDCD
ncbi:MAG: FliH/SctL family protein [Firmicutes bacterium]|nr:FliH/SctL family protein [Bacillota bacterium]